MPKPYAIVQLVLDVDTTTWQSARDGTDHRLPRPSIVGYYDRVNEAQRRLESAADGEKMLKPDALVVVGHGHLISLRLEPSDMTTTVLIQAIVKTGGTVRLTQSQVTLAEAMASAAGDRFTTSHIRLVESAPSTVAFPTLFNQSLPPAPTTVADRPAAAAAEGIEEEDES